jgi:hypothetical protein
VCTLSIYSIMRFDDFPASSSRWNALRVVRWYLEKKIIFLTLLN